MIDPPAEHEVTDVRCSNCNNTLAASAKFCPSCGAEQALDSAPDNSSNSDSAAIAGYIIFGIMVVGAWWWIGQSVDRHTLIYHSAFAGWIGFATFGFSRKWSPLVSFGGGFVGLVAVFAIALTIVADRPSVAGSSVVEPPVAASSSLGTQSPTHEDSCRREAKKPENRQVVNAVGLEEYVSMCAEAVEQFYKE